MQGQLQKRFSPLPKMATLTLVICVIVAAFGIARNNAAYPVPGPDAELVCTDGQVKPEFTFLCYFEPGWDEKRIEIHGTVSESGGCNIVGMGDSVVVSGVVKNVDYDGKTLEFRGCRVVSRKQSVTQ